MTRTRRALLPLLFPAALLLAVSGCKPEGSEKTAGKFDTSDPRNKPTPFRPGVWGDAALSPEMRETLERARMQSDAVGPADPALSNADRWQSFFDGSGRRAPIDDERIVAAMREQGVPSRIVRTVLDEARRQEADPVLVLSVIKQESGFDPRQRSPKGARGLMQVMPGTGRDLGVRNPKKLYDPQTNVRAGVTYLKDMFEQFSDVSIEDLSTVDPAADEGVRAALAAYNAGPHAVEKHQGVPPYRQTRDYVEQVLEYYRDFMRLFLTATPESWFPGLRKLA